MKVTYAMSKPPARSQNKLLAVLLTMSDRIAGDLELVDLPVGSVIYEAGLAERFVYFPNDAMIALLAVIENGKSVEVAVVGNEGMVGIDALTGGGNPCSQAMVQCAGSAYRMPTRLLKELLDRDNEMRLPILRYIQSLVVQISQAAVCNRHHSVEQQLCRKLLRAVDCLSGDVIALTQEKIAELLGVRREGITASAGDLKRRGAIDYHRGHIRILDREKLEKLSCECYAVVKSQCDSLRPGAFRDSTLNVV
ncbi:MAG: Crp/Fnr family transcriptional regulator, partial [Woeseia sp.]